MPYSIYIDPAVNCVFVESSGPFTVGPWDDAIKEFLAHPDYRQGLNILRDISKQIIPADLTFQTISVEVKRRNLETDETLGDCRLAILVGDPQSYAKAHQFIVAGRLRKSPVERKAFRELKTAKEWLGIPEDYEIKNPAPSETT